MRALLPLLLLLSLLAVYIHARELDMQPKYVGSAKAQVSLNWSVDLNGQKVSELQVKSFGFKDYPSQDVASEVTSMDTSIETDRYGNKIRLFSLAPSANRQSFGMVSQLSVDFPLSYRPAMAGEAAYYLKASPYVPLSSNLREQALQVTAGMDNDWKKLAALTLWVHNNVAYDNNFISISQDAGKVYENRLGTCDEFSHLLIAMLRSVGIPAKFSASFVYSGMDWGAHAFVEALIDDQWVPVDPTFNEALVLDATHIKFGEGLDQQDIKEDIVIRSFNADVGKVQLVRQFDVQLSDIRPFPSLFDMTVYVPPKRVGSQSLETVTVHLKNHGERIAIPLSLNVPKEVKVQGPDSVVQDKLVLLEPFEERNVSWKVLMPKLEDGFVYKFPVTVLSLGQNASASIEASVGGSQTLEEKIDVTSVSTEHAPPFVLLRMVMKNSGNRDIPNARLTLTTERFNQTQNVSLSVGSSQPVSFTLADQTEPLSATLYIDTEFQHVAQPIVITFERPTTSSDGVPDDESVAGNFGLPKDSLLVFLGALTVVLFLAVLALVSRGRLVR